MSAWARAACALLCSALFGCEHSGAIFQRAAQDDERDAAEDVLDAASEGDAASRDAAVRDAGSDAGASDSDAGSAGSVTALSAYEQVCASREDGTYCWGRNRDGQLGTGGDRMPVFAPRRLERALSYSQLCAGELHSCGLRSDGQIECWGGNAKGQLGQGDRAARDEPRPLNTSALFKALACGGQVTCAIAQDDQLYCWGDNYEGQGGQDDMVGSPDLLVPTRVAIERGIAQLSVGQGHVCALTSAGALYCWGRNNVNQLGLGLGRFQQIRTPTQLAGSSLYLSVAAGQEHTCAVRKDRRLLCWGESLDGRLGLAVNAPDQVPVPTEVGSLSDYQSVQANWFHSCALRTGGQLMCWGRNIEGQIGVGDIDLRAEPTPVVGLVGVSAFAVGRFHTCAARAGAVYCWGKNDEGQLGLGHADRRSAPDRVSF